MTNHLDIARHIHPGTPKITKRDTFIRCLFVILGIAAICFVILGVEAIITNNTCHWHYVWEYYTGNTRPNPADYCG